MMDSQTTTTQPTVFDPCLSEPLPASASQMADPPPSGQPHMHDAGFCERTILSDDFDSQRVAESLEKIVRAQNRLEQVRLSLEEVSHIALACRTVAGFIESVTRHLEGSLDLVAVKVLLVHDQDISEIFRRSTPYGGGIVSGDLARLSGESPFFLDSASDALQALFGDAAGIVASAAISHLMDGQRPFGVLCLGSGDPQRYSNIKSTVLIQALTEKISLGLLNALDHENAGRSLWLTNVKGGLYNEIFFREYLQKEFNRSCRSGKPFTLMAVSWRNGDDGAFSAEELMDLFRRNARAGDVAAQGESVGLWLLLPETESAVGEKIAERLVSLCKVVFPETAVNIGITEFSKTAAATSVLLNRAQEALEEAVMKNLPVSTKLE
jgi:uncharacterized protein YigA (DUF484 family)/GGDEF domain-containing protein